MILSSRDVLVLAENEAVARTEKSVEKLPYVEFSCS